MSSLFAKLPILGLLALKVKVKSDLNIIIELWQIPEYTNVATNKMSTHALHFNGGMLKQTWNFTSTSEDSGKPAYLVFNITFWAECGHNFKQLFFHS